MKAENERPKIGVHLLMWQKSLQTDVVPLMQSAMNAGFSGAEVSLAQFEHLQFSEIAREAHALNLDITCSFSLSPEFDIASSNPKTNKAAIDRFKKAIDHAISLGSPIITGPWYGGLGVWSKDKSRRQERIARSMENVSKVAEYASELGIVIGLEPLNRYETDLINTVQQAKQYIEGVGNQSLYIHLDTFHSSIEENSVPEAIREADTFLGHLHCADNHRGIPGSGCLPWQRIFQELQIQGYKKWHVVEVIGEIDTPIAEQFHYWRLGLPNPDQSAQEACKFIKDLME